MSAPQPAAPRLPTCLEIARWRAQAGLTQADCAALAYVTERTWRNWESGATQIPRAIWCWVLHRHLP